MTLRQVFDRRLLVALAIATIQSACGGSSGNSIGPAGKPKPDPFITVRVRDFLDTTQAVGRAHWHVYVNIISADANKAGFVPVGNVSLVDVRLHHTLLCQGIGADSVGQRFVAFVALADTTTEALTPDASAASLALQWFGGNHTLPTGWMALAQVETDPWTSAQYEAGHGLVPSDPIKWGWDWSDGGVATFYERTSGDTEACNTF